MRIERRLALLRLVLSHPLNRGRPFRTVSRYVGWQAWRRLVGRPLTIDFWQGLKVRVHPDWPYSWTALYLGLAEFDDMTFAVRYLRPGDAFVDVGANIGYYSLLASRVNAGSPVLALEPHPIASERLAENAVMNSFDNIRVRAVAAGEAEGFADLTAGLADQNHITPSGPGTDPTIRVPMVTLDAELGRQQIDLASVALVKIDTEGFETSVLAGSRALLDCDPGPVWVVEVNGSGARYGTEDSALIRIFLQRGYEAFRYLALENRIIPYDGSIAWQGNVIFARRLGQIRARLGVGTSSLRGVDSIA